MYNPTLDDTNNEWIELHNQMSVDMDVSGWTLAGAVQYQFPADTVIPGHGYLVVTSAAEPPESLTSRATTVGPWTGSLSNGGERIELYNNFNSTRTRPTPPPPPLADKLWSVDIQGVGGIITNPNPTTKTGAEANAGFGNVWNAFNVAGHSGTSTNPSMALVNSAGTATPVTFSIGGIVSGWSNTPGDTLIDDYLFVGAGNSAATITWQLTGLNPAATYDIFPYGGVARDMAWNVDRAGNGTLSDDAALIVTGAGTHVTGIRPDATGKIIGSMANGTGDAEGNWAGFQLVEISPAPAAASVAHLPGDGSLDGRRLMDSVEYDDGDAWPIEPDGSGVTLSKRQPDLGSAQPENWSFSMQVGGTPGGLNFAGTTPDYLSRITDISGNNNHGLPRFTAMETNGFEGRAGRFDGASSYATIPIDIGPTAYPQITFGAWVKSDSSSPSHAVVSQDDGGFDRTIGIGSGAIYLSPGGENVWNAFNVKGHPTTSASPSMNLVDRSGTPTSASFQILGSISGFSNPQNPSAALVNDYLFVSAGNSPANVDWRINGLVQGRAYDLYAYGGIARDIGLRVDVNGNGSLGDDAQQLVPTTGYKFVNVIADANGSVLGNAGPGTQGEGNWSGFQLVDKVSGTHWSVDIQAVDGTIGGQGIPLLQSGPLPAAAGAGYSAFAGNKQLNGSGQIVDTNHWAFITAVYDQATTSLAFYLDSDAATSSDPLQVFTDNAANLGNSALPTHIGRLPSGQWYFDGLIDNLFVVDRALSGAEVAALRSGGANAISALGTDVLAFYPFEDLPPGGLPISLPTLAINEVTSALDASFRIELTNTGTTAVALTGLKISSNEVGITDFVLPNQILQPGQFYVITQEMLGFRPSDGDALFLFTADRNSVIDAVHVDNTPRARRPDGTGPWLEPTQLTFGTANQVQLSNQVVINEIMYHGYPDRGLAPIPPQYATTTLVDWNGTWRYNQLGQSVAGGQLPTDWATTAHGVDNASWFSGPGVFSNTGEPLPVGITRGTALTITTTKRTYYFETEFTVPVDTPDGYELQIEHLIDDGAVFYLNGVEIIDRFNMPVGAITNGTPATLQNEATLSGGITLTTEMLTAAGFQKGVPQRLSVEVHQGGGTAGGATTSTDLVFGAKITSRRQTAPAIPGTPYTENPEEWFELYNRGTTTVDLTGYRVTGGLDFLFPPGTVIPANDYLVVAKDAAGLVAKYPTIATRVIGNFAGNLSNAGELIRLEDPLGNPADEVRFYDGGRWPDLADGGGSSLELRDPDADTSAAESWGASDESNDTSWRTYTYRGVAVDDGIGNNIFHEFVMGTLDAGTLLIDDVRVTENPGTPGALEFIQNGTFDADTLGASPARWRIVGNHFGTVVADPTNPSNKVLQLVTTGSTDDKHNHAETTYARSETVVLGNTYEISFRAKWVSGSNQLNTRLYFNYLQKTTLVETSTQAGTPGRANSRHVNNTGPTYSDFQHQPVVPKNTEPVTVSVNASDNNTVSSLTLLYSVNGGAYQQVPMTGDTRGNFTGIVPPQPASSVVQFYVEGRDSLGGVTTYPAEGRNSRALYIVDDGQGAVGLLHNVRIIMTPADRDLLYLNTNRMSNDHIGATIVYDEREVFYDVGARLKGSAFGRFAGTETGFNLVFHPDKLFRGVHPSIAIERAGNKKELLAMHMLGRAGGGLPSFYDDVVRIIAPRSAETGIGVLAMARYSDVFLEESFENGGDGALYNMELLYNPNGTVNGTPEALKLNNPYNHTNGTVVIANRGDDKETYRWNYQMRNARGRDNYDPLIQLSKAFSLTSNALDAATQAIMDVDQWMRTWAMLSLNGNDDIYTRIFDHNFRMYVRPEDGKIIALPWDLDRAFQIATNAPLWGDENLQKVIELPVNKRLFYGHAYDIINTTANTTYMSSWASHLGTLTGQSFAGELSYIGARGNYVLSQLPATVPFSITSVDPLDVGAASTATIAGRAWIDVREIRVQGSDIIPTITWNVATPGGTTPGGVWADGWQITLPVDSTTTQVVLNAYDHQGNLVGTDTIQVRSTAERRIVDQLRISELMYNPPEDGDATEYVELMNIGSTPTGSLAGVEFTTGITAVLGDVSLAPGERAVLVRDSAGFTAQYGTTPRILGTYTGSLDNGGEQLTLVDTDSALIQQFAYDDNGPGWHPSTDGQGRSLVIINPTAPVTGWNAAGSWRPSSRIGGSPSAADPLRGDLDLDGQVNATDIDALFAQIRNSSTDLNFDLNYDGSVDATDANELVVNILDTLFGDANLDHRVDATDLGRVNGRLFTGNAGWANGDFNGDSLVDGTDFNVWVGNRFQTRGLAESAQIGRRRPIPRAAQVAESEQLPADRLQQWTQARRSGKSGLGR